MEYLYLGGWESFFMTDIKGISYEKKDWFKYIKKFVCDTKMIRKVKNKNHDEILS